MSCFGWVLAHYPQLRFTKRPMAIIVVGLVGAALSIMLWLLVPLVVQSRAGRLAQLQYEPILRIDHETFTNWEDGVFRLVLVNTGIPDVENIRVYEDLYVGVSRQGGIDLTRFGVFLVVPNTIITKLLSEKRADFSVSLTPEVHQRMTEFYLSQRGGSVMKFLNITLKYRRVADGSEFSKMHLFIIAGGGTDLILMDYEASSGGLGGIPSDAVKAAIATHPMRH